MNTGATTATVAMISTKRFLVALPLVTIVVACATIAVATAADSRTARGAPWPERLVLREPPGLVSQAISGGFLYALLSKTNRPARGPYLLERTDLPNGSVRTGPLFPVRELTVATGKLWIFGSTGKQPHLIELDPHHLRVTRTIPLPQAATTFPWIAVAAGPDRSIWLGSQQTLRRIDADTGKTLLRLRVPARLAVGDLALAPSGHYLYVSMATKATGRLAGGTVLEYDARSGHEIAQATTGPPLSGSIAAARLTAVPDGVWASFRTGMLGLTIHLRQNDLTLQPPPSARVATTPANTPFHWPMDATTVYGGGSLWLANDAGLIACLNSTSGSMRASEHVSTSLPPDLLGVDARGHRLFALTGAGLVQIMPPRACWK